MRQVLIAAAVVLGALATPAAASETAPQAGALDQVEATYVRHNREHRLWEIERHMERQERWERRARYRHRYDDRYYDRGYGYGRRHGGPPPWAPAHGWRDRDYDDRW